jgi:hypothetical protein
MALLLGALPGAFFLLLLQLSYARGLEGAWAIDFNGNLRIPAQEILNGLSPYHPDVLERVRASVAAGGSPADVQRGVFAAYPAPALLLGVPFTYLPAALAEWLWVALMLAAGGLALHLAGARDWRIYGAVALTLPAANAVMLGSVDMLLMLGLAACWRWRDHAGRAGVALGALVALKLLAVPLVVWLIATRRYRAAAISLAVAAALCCAGWAAIGFDGLGGYPHLLSLLSEIEDERGYSLVHYATVLGLGSGPATLMPSAIGACLAAALWRVSRRGRAGDSTMFLLGVLSVLAFSPIVWQHYLVLVLVPLAVLQPRLSGVWFVPLLLWLTPDSVDVARPRELAMFALVIAVMSVRGLAHRRERLAAGAPSGLPAGAV